MFRAFKREDIQIMEKNAFHSDRYDILDLDDSWQRITYEENGVPVCVLSWNEICKGGIPIILVASVYFSMGAARAVKKFMAAQVSRLTKENPEGAKFIYTVSANNGTLNRWHKFLGMESTSSHVIDGKNFLIWTINIGI